MEKAKKRQYTKPQIIYRKKIETLAVVCDTARGGYSGCMKGSCARPWD